MERKPDDPAARVHETFGPLAEDLFEHFCEELSVAQNIDMFHIRPDDWDASDIAVFTVAYVAFVYRDWLFSHWADRQDFQRAIYREAESVVQRLTRSGENDGRSSGAWASRVDQLSRDWLAMRGAHRAAPPFSRTPEAISFVCRHLLKPQSQAKTGNLALMPFLQVYIPERLSLHKR
jgi:type VI protein secretion system component VasA